MSDRQNKWVIAITKLIRLTQEEKLKWEAATNPLPTAGHEKIEGAFTAIYQGKRLRIYKQRYEVKRPSLVEKTFGSQVRSSLGLEEPKYPYWTSKTILEFVGSDGIPLWQFPEVGPTDDLYRAVQYQAANVDEFLDAILAE